jgi:hypothetical protein
MSANGCQEVIILNSVIIKNKETHMLISISMRLRLDGKFVLLTKIVLKRKIRIENSGKIHKAILPPSCSSPYGFE